MAAEKAPAFQWYPKDYLADPVTVAMSLEAEGAYRRLIDYCWLEGSLPSEPNLLAPLAKARGPKHLAILWAQFGCKFRQTEGGRWEHPRLEAERQKQTDSRERRQKAADERWSKERALQMQSISNQDAMQCSSSPSSSSTPVIHTPASGEDEAGTPVAALWEAWRCEVEAELADVLPLAIRAKDFDYCRQIAAKQRPEAWVRLVMRQFLSTKHKDIAAKPRTLGYLLHWWSWIENTLAAAGYSPDKVAA